MPSERVQMLVGGVPFDGWEGLRVYRSLRSIAGRFSFNICAGRDRFIPAEFFGQRVDITANGDQVMAGYLETYDSSSIARQSRSQSIGGRSILGDLAVASADYFELHNTNRISIIERVVAPFGIPIINNAGTLGLVETYRVNPGQRAYQVVQDGLLREQAHAVETEDGSLELFRDRRGEHNGAKTTDAKRIQVSIDGGAFFSDYIVYSTSQAQTPAAIIAGEQPLAGRYRPIRLHPKSVTTASEAVAYAERYARRTRGQAMQVRMTFNGWRAAPGQLWQLGFTMPVNVPEEGVNQDMMITEISFDQAGTRSTITLESPDAFLRDFKAKSGPRGARRRPAASTGVSAPSSDFDYRITI